MLKIISLTNIIFKKILYKHNADVRQNIFDYNNLYKIGNKGYLKKYKKKFKKSKMW